MSLLTVEQFRQVLPDKFKKTVNQEFIDQVNQTLADPLMYENYRDNLLSYTHVMRDGKFTLAILRLPQLLNNASRASTTLGSRLFL